MSTEQKLLKACVEYRAKLDDLERENAALLKERNEWREKHWNAHHHAHQMFLETLKHQAELADHFEQAVNS